MGKKKTRRHHPPSAKYVMTSPDALTFCIGCNKSKTSLCSWCKSACYCSGACRDADWHIHKLLCVTFPNFDASSRPTDESIRAFLFPVDEEKPIIIWLHCEWSDDDDDTKYQHPYAEIRSLLGPDAFLAHATIQYNPVLKRELSDTIYICYRDTFLIDGSKRNNSIASIIATKPGWYHDWRGPIIAYGRGGHTIACKDLDMNDFRHVTDFFLSYGYRPAPAQQSIGAAWIIGIGSLGILIGIILALGLFRS